MSMGYLKTMSRHQPCLYDEVLARSLKKETGFFFESKNPVSIFAKSIALYVHSSKVMHAFRTAL